MQTSSFSLLGPAQTHTGHSEFTFFLQNLPFLLGPPSWSVVPGKSPRACLFSTPAHPLPSLVLLPVLEPSHAALPFPPHSPGSGLCPSHGGSPKSLKRLPHQFPRPFFFQAQMSLWRRSCLTHPPISVPPGPAHGMKVLLVLVLVHCPSLDPVLPLTYYLITFDLIFPIIRDAFQAPPLPAVAFISHLHKSLSTLQRPASKVPAT